MIILPVLTTPTELPNEISIRVRYMDTYQVRRFTKKTLIEDCAENCTPIRCGKGPMSKKEFIRIMKKYWSK